MSVAKTSELQDHLGYWLRFVSNHVSHAFRLAVERHGVTVAEWVVLRSLYDAAAAANPSQVADALGMTRGAVSKLVDRLAAKQLARTRAETADRRFRAVTLTPAGRALVPALARLADANDEKFFGHLAAPERAGLVATLRSIVERNALKGAPVH